MYGPSVAVFFVSPARPVATPLPAPDLPSSFSSGSGAQSNVTISGRDLQ